MEPAHRTFVVYVEDKPGVLNRVASLFRRRAYNIESLNVGRTHEAGASRMTIVVPADALDASFYDLRSGFAGEVLQKAANYRIRFAVVGDISRHVATSKTFHDLVVESERANGYCFVPDLEALERRLRSFSG